jgi:hypothetical protein
MWHSLTKIVPTAPGYITVVSGTPQPILPAGVPSCKVHGIKIQQVNGNTDPIYLLDDDAGSPTTGVGVVVGVPAPSYDTGLKPISLPSESASQPGTVGDFELKNLWVDGGRSGDQVLISILTL